MSSIRTTYFDTVLGRDFYDLMVGDKLGAGVSREVYVCRLDPTLVIKMEPHSYSFQNQAEWEVWDQVKKTKLAKWFAPLVRISPCGSMLIQKRTTPITPAVKMPEKIPGLFGDLKKENWGLLDGKVVCHDFGRVNAFYAGWTGITREKKAKWWSLEESGTKGAVSGVTAE